MENPVFTITMENGAVMTGELYPDKAPQTVCNFIHLANDLHFYDGLIFHRCIKGFMIQGGCPKGTGTGGPEWNIKGEFAQNGVPNDLSHRPGVISMARAQHPDSAGSQLFICTADDAFLDGQYAAFGKLTSGYEEAERISGVRTDRMDKPLEAERIATIRVDTRGVVYDEPDKL